MIFGEVVEKILKRSERDAKSGCLLFKGALDIFGFGKIRTHEGIRSVHRVMMLAHLEEKGEEIDAGMLVYHTCGNRNCVEITHLYLAPLQDPQPHTVKNPKLSEKAKQTKKEIISERERKFRERRKDRSRSSAD